MCDICLKVFANPLQLWSKQNMSPAHISLITSKVIAVERFRNRSGWLCGVNGQLDPFRNESSQRGHFVYTCACVRVHVHNMC